jgi:DNA-binding NarL/FixJ family response regulator
VLNNVQKSITVVLGDFSPLLSAGLEAVLAHDPLIEILASGLSDEALAETMAIHSPSVVIVSQTGARALVARLNALRCPTAPIVLARAPSRHFGLDLLASGATCLAESTPIEELLTAVHLARRGVRLFSTADERLERTWTAVDSVLTRREEEVLALLGRERKYGAIATELGISVETVRKHAANIKRKLGAGPQQDLAGIRA